MGALLVFGWELRVWAPPVDLGTILISTLVLFAAPTWAEMTAKPGPEVKKLDYFVGSWMIEGVIGQGAVGAGGKVSSTDTTEWMSGNFFGEGHSDFNMPPEVGGDGKQLRSWVTTQTRTSTPITSSTARDGARSRKARLVAIPGRGAAPRSTMGRKIKQR